jgi:hypothetical protein
VARAVVVLPAGQVDRAGPGDEASSRARRPGRRVAPAGPAGSLPGLGERGGGAAAVEHSVSRDCRLPARGLKSVARGRSLVRRARELGGVVVSWCPAASDSVFLY